MYLKSLAISLGDGTPVRNIKFHLGMNLIVDETPFSESRDLGQPGKSTGNNVGKTTVLRLIDFCLGGKAKPIYSDPENLRSEYALVKDFLLEKEVLIQLELTDDLLRDDARVVIVERNFLSRRKKVQRFDGEDCKNEEFLERLTSLLVPGHFAEKPTFRQIIAHNLRHHDLSINNTLRVLNRYTSDVEYETLYLFMFGCDIEHGAEKESLRSQLEAEEKFKRRLETKTTRSGYETVLDVLYRDIAALEERKATLDINENYSDDLRSLHDLQYQSGAIASSISRKRMRRKLIEESIRDLRASRSDIDVRQLEQLYTEATELTGGVQKTFEELLTFHNEMLQAKLLFLEKDLPVLDAGLSRDEAALQEVSRGQAEVTKRLASTEPMKTLENLVAELAPKYEQKGELEALVNQLQTTDERIGELALKLEEIDNILFADETVAVIRAQLAKFNQRFSAVSQALYDESYAIKVDTKTNKAGRKVYEFTAFNTNFSSGKKQGEIACFDIAYTLFADDEQIPCMHFLLNDKKELMDDNQLVRISKLVGERGIQFVAPILRSKLPEAISKPELIVLRLSQEKKLFRISE